MKIFKEGRNIVFKGKQIITKVTVNPGFNFNGTEEDWNKLPEYHEFKDEITLETHRIEIFDFGKDGVEKNS